MLVQRPRLPLDCVAWGGCRLAAGLLRRVARHRLPHLLDGMQRSAVSTHTAADDDQVIVILGWCCLGNN